MPNKGSRKTTDFVRHFSILMHENKLFVKYSTAHRLLNQCPRLAYGQNVDFWNLPVEHSPRLRAKRRFLRSARKTQTPVTGKTSISGICPQMLDPATPQVDKNNALLSIFVYSHAYIKPAQNRNQNKQCFPRSFARCNATTSHQPALHFQCKKAESPLHPRKFRINHPNVPYLTTITEQGAF